jgi:hypothetical protein
MLFVLENFVYLFIYKKFFLFILLLTIFFIVCNTNLNDKRTDLIKYQEIMQISNCFMLKTKCLYRSG